MGGNTKRIALQRIQVLFQLAKENIHDRPDLAQRYVEIARKIAMRTRLHLPLSTVYISAGSAEGLSCPALTRVFAFSPVESLMLLLHV